MSQVVSIGKHRVTHASIDHSIIDTMLQGQTINILYCDPPWGDGMMKFFATLNKKQTGFRNDLIEFDQLIDRLFQLTKRYVSGYACIEVGEQWVEPLKKQFENHGLFQTTVIKSKYGKRPCFTIVAGTSNNYPVKKDIFGNMEEMSGGAVSGHIVGILKVENGKVLDPCCGLGFTAKATIDAEMTFYGNEVNALRLQKTVEILRRNHA
jgi:hypothetical protein